RQARVFDRDRVGGSGGALDERHRGAVGDLGGRALPGPDLRTLEILQHRDRLAARLRRLAHNGEPARVLRVRAVREIEARDVHPRVDQAAYRLDVVRRGTQRTDDLGVAQTHVRWHLRD